MSKPIEYDSDVPYIIVEMRKAVGNRRPIAESAVCAMWQLKKNSLWRVGIADDVEICELILSHECLRKRLFEAEQKLAKYWDEMEDDGK